MTYSQKIALLINAKASQVEATILLLDEGNTVPFIARYRKEMTGSLDDEQVRIVADEVIRLRTMDKRRKAILKSIEEQGKLTKKLQDSTEKADTLTMLEDLYAPYKRKRRTRAVTAIEKGLEPLSDLILKQPLDSTPEKVAAQFLGDEVPTIDEALQGARDIIAETIKDNAKIRATTREKALKFATLTSKKIKKATDERRVFESYSSHMTVCFHR